MPKAEGTTRVFRQDGFWFKIALLGLFAAFYATALTYPEQSRQFPQLLAVIGFALTMLALVLDLRRRHAPGAEISGVDDTEMTVQDPASRRLRRKRYVRAWTIILVATVAGALGGFLFTAFVLFAGFGFFVGERETFARNLAISATLTGVVYLVFAVAMKVPLLDGALW